MKTPKWFQEWLLNDWFHTQVRIRVMMWCLGIVAAMTTAILLKIYLG